MKDIRPVDRVPAEPGMWVSPLNFTLPPLGDEVTPPMDPVMIATAYEVAKILRRLTKKHRELYSRDSFKVVYMGPWHSRK